MNLYNISNIYIYKIAKSLFKVDPNGVSMGGEWGGQILC